MRQLGAAGRVCGRLAWCSAVEIGNLLRFIFLFFRRFAVTDFPIRHFENMFWKENLWEGAFGRDGSS
jgi:hypothetical protein